MLQIYNIILKCSSSEKKKNNAELGKAYFKIKN
jgi:hypothetical protein